MQLNRFSDYALRVLIHVAAKGQVERSTIGEIAERFGISRHHLVKVVAGLHSLGYLDTRQGRGGGFTLARAPHKIFIGELLRQTEGSLALVECFDADTNGCRLTPVCGLKRALSEALSTFFATLDGYTLADFVEDRRPIRRALGLLPLSQGESHG